jgi:hypothetical protein
MLPLDDVKTWLKIPLADTTYDALLQDMEERAVATLQRILGRYFGPNGATTEREFGDRTNRLWLLEVPTVTTTATTFAVTERAEIGDTGTALMATAADGYELRAVGNEAWLARKGGHTWLQGYEYTVAYRRGYLFPATATTGGHAPPGDIEQLLLDLIALKWNQLGKQGIVSETIDNYSYRLGDFRESDLDAIPGWKSIAEKWRRPNV